MANEQVTKDMLIGDIIAKHPEVASIMLSYGLHCVGCSANPFDTIESGCIVHGMDEEIVDNLVNDINESLSKKKDGKIVSVTKKAAAKFLEFMKSEDKTIIGVRLGIVENNGSIQYSLDFAEVKLDSEDVFEDNGIKIFVEKDNLENIKGIEIDYVENKNGSGFKIDNFTSKGGSCGSGCGCTE